MYLQLINSGLGDYEVMWNRLKPSLQYRTVDHLFQEFDQIASPEEADEFFGKYGVGNVSNGQVHLPFERTKAYELLLLLLENHNRGQYLKIHKGTPYYFIAWTAYQYEDFRKANFYMDAAVSEDLKFPDVQAKTSVRPSLDFFLLRGQPGPSGHETHMILIDVIKSTLDHYNQVAPLPILFEEFKTKFVDQLLYGGPEDRSLLTALYTFILEFDSRKTEIQLRSDKGGSIQPFLDHLFDGARVWESLLERAGATGMTLGKKIPSLPALNIMPLHTLGGKKLSDAEIELQSLKSGGQSFQDYNFAASYIIRNTTGHSLLWLDAFQSPSTFNTLYNCLINSILWTIQKCWL